MQAQKKNYYQFLFELGEEIGDDDLQSMKFLCMEEAIPQSELENIHSGNELFDALLQHGLLKTDDLSYIHSAFFESGRMDLCTRIQNYAGVTFLAGRHELSVKLSDVRKLMLRTALELETLEVKNFSYMLNVPRSLRESIKSGIDLFTWLQSQKQIDSEGQLMEAVNEWGLTGVFKRMISKRDFRFLRSYPPATVCVCEDVTEDSGELEYFFVTGKFGEYYTVWRNSGMTMTQRLLNEEWRKCLATNEKYAFVKYPFILPVHSVRETSPWSEIIYSVQIVGTLDQVCAELNWKIRTRVLYQISSALTFLHKPVPPYRGILVHHSLTADSIFLDAAQNALLGSDALTEISLSLIHPPVDASKDIFDLGIVTLQMLKWQPVEQLVNRRNGCNEKFQLEHLFNGCSSGLLPLLQTKNMFDADVWCYSETGCEIVAECLAVSARECLVSKSDEYLAIYEQELKERLSEDCLMNGASVQNCTYCRLPIKEADLKFEVIRGNDCMSTCPNSYFCSNCIRNSFRNPLNCVDHGPVYTPFNHPMSIALLFSGSFDYPDEQQAIQVDIANVRRVITNPRIIGFRMENVHDVRKMSELTGIFDKVGKSLECLFVYYSGHTPVRGCETADSKYTNILDLKRWLKDNKITFTRSIFIVDCCCAASNVKPISDQNTATPRITIFACADDNESTCASPEHGSTFTRYLLTGLRGDRKCPCSSGKSCQYLISFYSESSVIGFVTAEALIHYVQSHFNMQQPVLKNVSSKRSDGLLGFYNNAPVFYDFSFVRPGLPPKRLEIDRHNLDLSVSFDCAVQSLRKYLAEDGILSTDDRSTASFRLRTHSRSSITDLRTLTAVLGDDETVEILVDTDRRR